MDGTDTERLLYRITAAQVVWYRVLCPDCDQSTGIAHLIASIAPGQRMVAERLIQFIRGIDFNLCTAIRGVADFGQYSADANRWFVNRCQQCEYVIEDALTETRATGEMRSQPVPRGRHAWVEGQLGPEIKSTIVENGIRTRYRRDRRVMDLFNFPPYRRW